MQNRKEIYPYLVLIACAGLIATTFGLVNIQGLFFDSISNDLGIGKASTAFFVTLIHISGAIFAPAGVKLRDKFSIRQILLVDGLAVTLSLMLIPSCNAIWQIYVLAFIIGTGQGIYGHTMVVELINRWFKRAGTAVGVAMCASGIYGSVFSPIIVNSIVKYGWRKAYYIFAMSLAVVLIYSFIVIKDKPGDVIKKAKNNEKVNTICIETFYVATFYLFTSSMASFGSYMLGFATDIGLSMNQGAGLSSAINMGNLLLKLLFGFLCDEIGGYRTSLLAFGMITLGSAILIFVPAQMYTVLALGSFLLGATFAGSNVLTSSICRNMFGKEKVSYYYATITSLSVISAFSSTVIGGVYDISGSYKYSILGFEILIGIALVLVKKAFKRKKRHAS